MAAAPTIAIARLLASAIRASPSDSTAAAPAAQRRGPTRSGRSPATKRVSTTVAAKTVNATAPWESPFARRCRTMNDAIAA